jgi:hypothetical protein
MTLERYYWSDFVTGQDNIRKGIKALVDIHLPNPQNIGLGVKEIRSVMCETYLTLSSIAIDQFRADHVLDMDVKFIIQKAYDDALQVYQSMPSSIKVISDRTLTLTRAVPMLNDIIMGLDGDASDNQNCIALRYINYFAQSNNNKIKLSHWLTKKSLLEQFQTSFESLSLSQCIVGTCFRSTMLREKIQSSDHSTLPLISFLGPLLSSHLSAAPLKISNVSTLTRPVVPDVNQEQTDLVVCVINDFIKALYSEPVIDNFGLHKLNKTALLSLRKSLESLSLALEDVSVNHFFADYVNNNEDDSDLGLAASR